MSGSDARRKWGWTAGVALMAPLLLAGCGAVSAQAPASASPSTGNYFADAGWNGYALNSQHNAAVPLAAHGADAIRAGVKWNYPEFDAVPLNQNPLATKQFGGIVNAAVTMTQNLGNSVGVTAWGHSIYAASSSDYIYAVNAATGKPEWRYRTLNVDMSNPVVHQGVLYAGTGNVAFNFPALLTYPTSAETIRGGGYGGVYALNANSGQMIWFHPLVGNQMPTPAYYRGKLYFANGNGYFYALDAQNGNTVWKTFLSGFDGMSSTNVWTSPATGQTLVYAGMTHPNDLYALDAHSGKVAWKLSVPDVTLTGMGDATPAVSQSANVLIEAEAVKLKMVQNVPTVNFVVLGIDPATGAVKWQDALGRGPLPAAYRAAVPMVHNGTVYVADTATSTEFAIDAKSGLVKWHTQIPHVPPAGAGRGAPTYYGGLLWVSTGSYIDVFNPRTGQVLVSHYLGGRFGIVNPVIAGGTMYLDNSYNWIMAVPLSQIDPGWKSQV